MIVRTKRAEALGMTLSDVLTAKGGVVFALDALETAADAVRMMRDRAIGSVLVTVRGELVGIFTERDAAVEVLARGLDPRSVHLWDVVRFRDPPCTMPPDGSVVQAMELMRKHRQRHLPVVENDRVVGMASVGDLLHHVSRDLRVRLVDMATLVHGPYARPEVPALPRPPDQETGWHT
jgi:CBS domain-containing protein